MSFFQEPTNWVAISFAIFAVLFMRYGWKGVTAKLDARINDIRTELETAEKLRIEAQEMLVQYQRKHRDAMLEAKDIADRARAQAETIRKKAEEDLRETIARREKQLEDRLNRIEASAEAELRKATAELALRASDALIRKSLDAKAQGQLAEKAIAALPGNLAA